MVKSLVPQSNAKTEIAAELAECGWRTVIVEEDGRESIERIPLTSEEFLHPQEGYHLPINTFHDNITGDAKDMLIRRYAKDESVGVFRDLIIVWDDKELKDHCPDVCVVFGLQNKEENRSSFIVAEEGVKPSLIIEVVSPRYRKEDRETKVVEYEQAGVQEYVIIDRRTQRGQKIDEVLGYTLINRRYRLLTPDDDGRILCETVGLWISLRDGNLVMEDAETGERLLSSGELEERASQAETRASQAETRATEAETRATEAETRATEAETRAAQLAELLRAQGIDPDQV